MHVFIIWLLMICSATYHESLFKNIIEATFQRTSDLSPRNMTWLVPLLSRDHILLDDRFMSASSTTQAQGCSSAKLMFYVTTSELESYPKLVRLDSIIETVCLETTSCPFSANYMIPTYVWPCNNDPWFESFPFPWSILLMLIFPFLVTVNWPLLPVTLLFPVMVVKKLHTLL